MFGKTCRIFAIILVLSIVLSSCEYGNQVDPSADTATQANENTVSAVEEQTTAKAEKETYEVVYYEYTVSLDKTVYPASVSCIYLTLTAKEPGQAFVYYDRHGYLYRMEGDQKTLVGYYAFDTCNTAYPKDSESYATARCMVDLESIRREFDVTLTPGSYCIMHDGQYVYIELE
jgi:hypothetical protein